MAIKLQFTGMCEGCPIPDLELDELQVVSWDDPYDVKNNWTVKCKKEDACKMWAEREDR